MEVRMRKNRAPAQGTEWKRGLGEIFSCLPEHFLGPGAGRLRGESFLFFGNYNYKALQSQAEGKLLLD